MDVSLHFHSFLAPLLRRPSMWEVWQKSALLWPFKATEIYWQKIHLLSSGEAEAAEGQWQEW